MITKSVGAKPIGAAAMLGVAAATLAVDPRPVLPRSGPRLCARPVRLVRSRSARFSRVSKDLGCYAGASFPPAAAPRRAAASWIKNGCPIAARLRTVRDAATLAQVASRGVWLGIPASG